MGRTVTPAERFLEAKAAAGMMMEPSLGSTVMEGVAGLDFHLVSSASTLVGTTQGEIQWHTSCYGPNTQCL
jgi:hypothetical protein